MNTFNEESAGTRNEQKAQTRRAVLEAARAAFEGDGFEGANIRDIASAAGVSAGTVLHHFGSKRELLYAALFHDLERALEGAVAGVGRDPLEDQLDRLSRAVFHHYQERPRLSRVLLKESLFAEPPWAERFQAQTAGVHQAVVCMGEAAVARGELSPRVDLRVLAMAYLSFFYFALIAWAQGAHADPARLVRAQVVQHLDGLASPSTTEPPSP
jgi:AcrR family transcriptional regulator